MHREILLPEDEEQPKNQFQNFRKSLNEETSCWEGVEHTPRFHKDFQSDFALKR